MMLLRLVWYLFLGFTTLSLLGIVLGIIGIVLLNLHNLFYSLFGPAGTVGFTILLVISFLVGFLVEEGFIEDDER